MHHRVWVAGAPAGFANGQPEARWKQALEESLADRQSDGTERALRLRFVLPPVAPGQPGADLDNLLDAVLSVIVGRLGWFEGRRPAIDGIVARKERGIETGCEIELLAAVEAWAGAREPFLDAFYEGALPRSGNDAPFTDWVSHQVPVEHPAAGPQGLGVSLAFGDPRLNLGDIATGRPKNVIDCLWPLIGGVAGAPDDHLITALRLSRDESLGGGGVRLTVCSR